MMVVRQFVGHLKMRFALKKIKIVVIADMHCSHDAPDIPHRIGHYADIFLGYAIQLFNSRIKPDIVFLAGDILDNPIRPKALYKKIKKILEELESPYVIIPGNHDRHVDFYEEFGQYPDHIDLNGFRIIPFDDPELPGYNAVRNDKDLARLQKNISEFDGPIISLQHVPLIEADKNPCREHFTNADEIIEMIRNGHGGITIAGHNHPGVNEVIDNDGVYSIVVPAFCEAPFKYMIIDVDANLDIKIKIEQLKQ
jgi:metallophosphoesterase superfamily enzyme